jgi:hypothetical protein
MSIGLCMILRANHPLRLSGNKSMFYESVELTDYSKGESGLRYYFDTNKFG